MSDLRGKVNDYRKDTISIRHAYEKNLAHNRCFVVLLLH